MKELNDTLRPIIPFTEPIALTDKEKETGNVKLLKQRLKEEAGRLYEAKEAEFPNPETMREIERVILLKVIDRKWMAHIDDMAQLKTGIGLQSFGSKDPVVEYKFAGYDMFNDMTASIQEDTARMILHVRIEEKVEREQVAKVTGTNKDDSVKKGPVKRASAKVGRNDPCPCGSGKKYKMCCGRNL
jgi:preprotein translocase subunit SecA